MLEKVVASFRHFNMPQPSEGIDTVRVTKIYKKVGDEVHVDDDFLDISTDKVDLEVQSPHTGTLFKLECSEGLSFKVGDRVATFITADTATGGQEIELRFSIRWALRNLGRLDLAKFQPDSGQGLFNSEECNSLFNPARELGRGFDGLRIDRLDATEVADFAGRLTRVWDRISKNQLYNLEGRRMNVGNAHAREAQERLHNELRLEISSNLPRDIESAQEFLAKARLASRPRVFVGSSSKALPFRSRRCVAQWSRSTTGEETMASRSSRFR